MSLTQEITGVIGTHSDMVARRQALVRPALTEYQHLLFHLPNENFYMVTIALHTIVIAYFWIVDLYWQCLGQAFRQD